MSEPTDQELEALRQELRDAQNREREAGHKIWRSLEALMLRQQIETLKRKAAER